MIPSLDDELAHVRLEIERARTPWAIGALGALIVLFAILLYASGISHERDRAQRAATQAKLQANTAALDTARKVTAVAHTAVVASTNTAAAANRHADTKRGAYTAARAHVTFPTDSSVSIDQGPAMPAVPGLVALIRSADETIASLDSARVADAQLQRAQRDENAALTHERDLYHDRADTLQTIVDRGAAPRCGTKCKTVLVVGGVYAVIRAVPAIARHLLPGFTPTPKGPPT